MKQRRQSKSNYRHEAIDPTVSRRLALRSSGWALLGLLSGSAPGQTENAAAEVKKPTFQPPKEFQERIEKQKAFSERLRNASGGEERRQIMNEQMAWQRQLAFDSLREQLRISDQEWPVVKPRLQAVYDLVRPATQVAGRNAPPKTEVEQRNRELAQLVQADKPDAEQIKAKLTAYRAAKSKASQELAAARQNLRQILNLRQEAVLVLNGLLD